MEIKLCKQDLCTGCSACIQACNQKAIDSVSVDGFIYPQINKDRCIECGSCMMVCPVINANDIKGNCHKDVHNCIAAFAKEDEVRMESSSGGSFTIMAEKIIFDDGVVYGAAWDKNMRLSHKGITKIENLDELRKSKYVQSEIGNTYKEIKEHLRDGRKVLFCGTPCQVAGLVFFLHNKEYPNLYLVDVLCQGVPSSWSFQKYISEVEYDLDASIIGANFRSKKHGWRCGLSLVLRCRKDGKEFQKEMTHERNSYYRSFVREYFMRPSCYSCQFKDAYRGYYSDITIADFWRIGNTIPVDVKGYEKGISAVILNTDKGESFFGMCSERLHLIVRQWSEYSTNGGLQRCHKPSNNDAAFTFLKHHSWRETQSKFFPESLREFILTEIRLKVGQRIMRKFVKF